MIRVCSWDRLGFIHDVRSQRLKKCRLLAACFLSSVTIEWDFLP